MKSSPAFGTLPWLRSVCIASPSTTPSFALAASVPALSMIGSPLASYLTRVCPLTSSVSKMEMSLSSTALSPFCTGILTPPSVVPPCPSGLNAPCERPALRPSIALVSALAAGSSRMPSESNPLPMTIRPSISFKPPIFMCRSRASGILGRVASMNAPIIRRASVRPESAPSSPLSAISEKWSAALST